MKQNIPFRRGHRFYSASAFCLGAMLYLSPPSRGAENVIPCQQNQDTAIKYGDIVNCSIESVGNSDVVQFSGNIGETITAQITKRSGVGSPTFVGHAPDGAVIGVADGFGRLTRTLDQTGPYTILVNESGNNQTVDYALIVERVAPPSPTARETQYGKTLNDSITPLVDFDPIFFEASAGDTVTVQIFKRSGVGTPTFVGHAPDGAVIGVADGFGRLTRTLDQTGPYTILVNESGNNQTVDYALIVQCTSGDCIIVPIPAIAGCIYLKGSPLQGRRVDLIQPNEIIKSTTTDVRGCYEFAKAKSGKSFQVKIFGPSVP